MNEKKEWKFSLCLNSVDITAMSVLFVSDHFSTLEVCFNDSINS